MTLFMVFTLWIGPGFIFLVATTLGLDVFSGMYCTVSEVPGDRE
jgi:hypothetical protein